MRFLHVIILAVAVLAGAGAWVLSTVEDARRTVETFCTTTRTGESLARLESRAKKVHLSLQTISHPSAHTEARRAVSSALGRHFGCVVELAGGRVQATRFAELPSP